VPTGSSVTNVEITKRLTTDGLEVTVNGRLDSYWADHLAETLEEAVRTGSHDITLDLADVHYMSSAGIRVLVITHKRLSAIQGRLRITNPSEMVVKILQLSGLASLLLAAESPMAEASASEKVRASTSERDGVEYTTYDTAPGERLRCRVIGDPRRLDGCRFRAEDATVMSIPASSTVVGLGAFGSEYRECRSRFGEFLSVSGTAAYLPTDGSGIPDYFVSAEPSLPEMTLLYGVSYDGAFARLVRFEATKDSGHVSLSQLIEDCLSLGEVDAAGLVLVAESAGLAGAALRRSPAMGSQSQAPFDYPEIREWLSFSSERLYARSVVVAAGVATRVPSASLASMVRPLGENELPAGHIHAAAFSYAPLPRGNIRLRETVAGLFENEKLESVLHLLRDGRPITGAGESAFSRGACWIGSLDGMAERGSGP
jgi:anti-anti-sigma factor